MADDWIKMRMSLQSHPKVVRILSATQSDKFRVIGGLHAVWCVFDTHSTDGELHGYSTDALDHIIGWDGFSQAMVDVGWLEVSDHNSLVMPDFSEHNGKSAKRRAEDTRRKRKDRCPQNVRNVSAECPQDEGTGCGPEKEKEKRSKNPLVDSDETTRKPKTKQAESPPEFEALWSEYPQREGPNPKRDALKAYRARMREGVSPDDLLAGVRRYKAWLMSKGKVGTEFVQRASTFLGPSQNWQQTFEAQGGLARPADDDREAWLRMARQAGVEHRIAGKTHDQIWAMICEFLAQKEKV